MALEANATEVQRVALREISKKMGKSCSLIHHCVDSNVFEKIIEKETIRDVWVTLKKLYGGDEKLKKVKLQSLRKQYENLHCLVLLKDGGFDKPNKIVWRENL